MKDDVKLCVDSRKNVVISSFELNDSYLKKLDELFVKIYDLAATCANGQDFESKFASSPLNQEYMDLYTDIAKSCKCKTVQKIEEDKSEKRKRLAEEAASDAKYLVDDITMPARRQARMQMDSKLRDTPLGKVEQASNMFHLFKRFKKPKKTDESLEE